MTVCSPKHPSSTERPAHLPRRQHCYPYPRPLTCTEITYKRFGLTGKLVKIFLLLRRVCGFLYPCCRSQVVEAPTLLLLAWECERAQAVCCPCLRPSLRNPRPCRVSQGACVHADGRQPKLNSLNQYDPSHIFPASLASPACLMPRVLLYAKERRGQCLCDSLTS